MSENGASEADTLTSVHLDSVAAVAIGDGEMLDMYTKFEAASNLLLAAEGGLAGISDIEKSIIVRVRLVYG